MNILELLAESMGSTKGKGSDDDVPVQASEGEYIIPAMIVAKLGDGNTEAGAKVLDELVSKIDSIELQKGQSLLAMLGGSE